MSRSTSIPLPSVLAALGKNLIFGEWTGVGDSYVLVHTFSTYTSAKKGKSGGAFSSLDEDPCPFFLGFS